MNKALCITLILAVIISIIVVVAYTRDQPAEMYVAVASNQPQNSFENRCTEECLAQGVSGMPHVCRLGCQLGFPVIASVGYSSRNEYV
jgi:hypothetical protein